MNTNTAFLSSSLKSFSNFASTLNLDFSEPTAEYWESELEPVIDISDSIYIDDVINEEGEDAFSNTPMYADRAIEPNTSVIPKKLEQEFKQEILDEISAKLGFSLGTCMF